MPIETTSTMLELQQIFTTKNRTAMKNRIIFFLVALFAIACGKDDDEGTSVSGDICDPATGNYLNGFIVAPGKTWLEFVEGGVNLSPKITISLTDSFGFVSYASSDSTKFARYKKYVEFYGDTTYHSMHFIDESAACASPLSSITVVADRDFDETHPAGTVLNDLFQISYPRFYQYIKSGYKPKTRMNSFQLDSICELAVFKDISLFAQYTTLIFKSTPATPGKYTFTVTFDFGADPLTGEKVNVPPASIEIEF